MIRVKEQVQGRAIQIDFPFNSFENFWEEVYQKMERIGEAFITHLKNFQNTNN
jgi:hypothetical protein